MSTLKVASINNPSASSGGLAISTAGNVTGAGLDLIVSQSFSAVSSVSIDGCFTSEYDNYRVVVQLVGSASAATQARLRVSGADNSAASYDIRGTSQAGATGRYAALSATYFDMGLIDANQSMIVADFITPFVAQATTLSYISYGQGTHIVASGRHGVTTAFDGFTIYPASGTLTGSIAIYGYRN